MAVVGSAYVVVRALTDKVESDIRRGFSGASASAGRAGADMGNALTRGLGNSFRRNNKFTQLSAQLAAIYPEAKHASDAFTKLMRAGYLAQSGLGALVGSLGAIVGGLGALAGAAGGAAGGLVAVAGAAVSLRVGFAIASMALRGISQAVSAATSVNGGYSKSLKQIKLDAEEAALGVDRAGLNLEKAKEGLARVADLAPNSRIRREAELAVKEAELALKKAREAEKNPDTGGGSDPYAGLTPSQKQFAQFLAGLKPQFDKLKEAVAKGFLPALEEQMNRLIKAGLLEILEARFYDIAVAMGEATKRFTDVVLSGDNLRDFNKILQNIAGTLPQFGSILGNAFSGVLSVLEAADPLTRRFVSYLESKSGALRNFLDAKQATGELEDFFDSAGDLAARFGTVFGNTFGTLGNIIQANFGAGSGGDIMLTWLEKVTDRWNSIGVSALQTYFERAAKNFVSMGDAIGSALGVIVEVGANPAVREFWDAMAGGADAFRTIVEEAVKSAPSLGRVLRNATEIVALFSDSGAPKAFFDTIASFAAGTAKILERVKWLLDFVGPITASISAFGFVTAAASKFGIVTIGYIAKLLTMFGVTLPGALLATTGATKGATAAMSLFNKTNPVGWVVTLGTAIMGVWAAVEGAEAARSQERIEAIARGFKDGSNALKIWQTATGSTKSDLARTVRETSLHPVASQVKVWGAAMNSARGSIDELGDGLRRVFKKDVPLAHQAMQDFQRQTGMSDEQLGAMIQRTDGLENTLRKYADSLGIVIPEEASRAQYLQLAEVATGRGAIAQAELRARMVEATKASGDQAQALIDLDDAYDRSTKNGVTNLKKFFKLAEKEAADAAAYQKNRNDLIARGHLDLVLKLDSMELENRDSLYAQLAKKDDTYIAKRAEKMLGSAKTIVDGTNSLFERIIYKIAGPDGTVVKIGGSTARKDGGFMGFRNGGLPGAKNGFVTGAGTARSDSIATMISNGEYIVNARATAANRELLDTINSNRSVSTAPIVNVTVNPAAGMDEEKLARKVSSIVAFQIAKGAI